MFSSNLFGALSDEVIHKFIVCKNNIIQLVVINLIRLAGNDFYAISAFG